MNPNFRQLEAFTHVYRLASVTRAAAHMHLTPSAVSILIGQLEENWETRLFDRTTRRLHATPAARDAIEGAERLLRDMRSLGNRMRTASERVGGTTRVAVSASFACSILPLILKRLAVDHPGTTAKVFDVAPDQLIGKLESGDVELAIGTVSDVRDEFQMTTLVSDQICALCLINDPLSKASTLTWADLHGHPTISVRQGDEIRALIDDAMTGTAEGFSPVHEVSLLTTALAMTAQGLGASILPGHLARFVSFSPLVAVPMVGPVIRRDISLITRRGRSLSEAAKTFVAVAKDEMVRPSGRHGEAGKASPASIQTQQPASRQRTTAELEPGETSAPKGEQKVMSAFT